MSLQAQELLLKENLRFLRKRKGITQESLASSLGMSRDKYKAIETGHTVNPPIEDLVRLSRFFRLNMESLLLTDLTQLSEANFQDLEAGSDVYLSGKNIRVLAISVDPQNKENVEYIPVKARAGYRAGHSNPEYLAALPKFNIPNLPEGYTFRMFPTAGDSMLPIPEGSDILASYVQNWKSVKDKTPCIVILNGEQDFVFKLVSFRNNGKTLLLQSFNKSYADYSVDISEVVEIWQYYSFHSKALPEFSTDLQHILAEIKKLEKHVVNGSLRKLKNYV